MNPITTVKLKKEEKEIERAIENGDYTSVKDFRKEKKRYEGIAKSTLAKSKTITVRMSERNLMHLKTAAAREGISYQTLVSSLIQKNT